MRIREHQKKKPQQFLIHYLSLTFNNVVEWFLKYLMFLSKDMDTVFLSL